MMDITTGAPYRSEVTGYGRPRPIHQPRGFKYPQLGHNRATGTALVRTPDIPRPRPPPSLTGARARVGQRYWSPTSSTLLDTYFRDDSYHAGRDCLVIKENSSEWASRRIIIFPFTAFIKSTQGGSPKLIEPLAVTGGGRVLSRRYLCKVGLLLARNNLSHLQQTTRSVSGPGVTGSARGSLEVAGKDHWDIFLADLYAGLNPMPRRQHLSQA